MEESICPECENNSGYIRRCGWNNEEIIEVCPDMGKHSQWRVNCFFCQKLMPPYAPGTMVSKARHEDDETRYICSKCYRKITMVIHNTETVRESIVRADEPAVTGKRVVEV